MTAPLILGFDTSAAHCAAALLSGDELLAERSEPMARGQAERLFPMLLELLDGAGVGWSDLSALAVGTGPGNFTGLRVAVSAARGLALSTGRPVFGVDGFSARAVGAAPGMVAVSAPRGAVHLRRVGEGLDETVQTMDIEAALALARAEGLPLIGDVPEAPPAQPIAVGVAREGMRRLRMAEVPDRPVPLYVRPADAAPAREAAPRLLP